MLLEKLKNYELILASQSPRRKELLAGLDMEFTTLKIEVEEVYDPALKQAEISDYLAQLKAKDVALNENQILITSDTIVWSEGACLGKPKSKEEAQLMIEKLSGKSHQVFTSVCLKTTKESIVFHQETKVKFSAITKEEIAYYIDKYSPMDKAGSYGIQEWIGYAFIEKIEGSYFAVMGLPVQKLYQNLKNLDL